MDTDRTQRPRSPRGEGESLRGDILAAADELITEAGSGSDLSLRAIARRTGVSPMTLYRHFDTLEAIVDEVQRRHYLELVEVLRDHVENSDDGLSAFAQTFVGYGLSNPGRFRLMFAMPLNPERVVPDDKQILGTPALELLVGTMRAHLTKHRLERDPWRAATTLWATLHGIVHLRLSVGMRGDYAWPPVETQIADALAPFTVATA
ncbi:TetR/AcrR family transcriptional regulator [Tsukamurella sp. M9C]|uniref:TetR/AcrR family transcriptional regulator n=1 Tax=unclassified Tsukamurella TaxID=2633480 RepID=UPI001CCA36DE|nr:TetR/AcrR family transcriptional regulator [Tsukamurella sp. M9C]MCA0155733.1 TetR/AcrR family transcriptional regulator [Tsukamurella sp. M9C]